MQNYHTVDQQLHWLSQVIAKANRTYVPQKEDDSHTNLYYDALGDRITGRWIEGPSGAYLLSLYLPTLEYEWIDKSMLPVKSVPSTGRRMVDIEAELSEELITLGLDKEGFTDALHFEIPDYDFASDKVNPIDSMDLEQWKYWRKVANDTCAQVLGYLQSGSEIRIWPHHFDTGIYFSFKDNLGLGFGLAMEDKMAGAPYFYLAGYTNGGSIDYTALSDLGLGKWETEGDWKGAVLPLSKLTQLGEQEKNVAIRYYLKSSIGWFVKHSVM